MFASGKAAEEEVVPWHWQKADDDVTRGMDRRMKRKNQNEKSKREKRERSAREEQERKRKKKKWIKRKKKATSS